MTKIKAVGLVSGGLDSLLATRTLMEQGIEVFPVNFNTGFCVNSARRKIKKGLIPDGRLQHDAVKTSQELNIPVHMVDISDEYLDVVTHPKHGYGSAFNPCIDCRIFMLKKAREIMDKIGAHFIYTGEVVGQRPMSQHMKTMRNIEKESGLEGLLLRPLSAKLLEPTIPEQKGWVDRDKLHDISGRSRKKQMELVEKFGILNFSQPAGGCCFLVDHNFAKRMKDLLNHNGWIKPTRDEIALLQVGRQFRLHENLKVIVGRNEGDNNYLTSFQSRFITIFVNDYGTPTSVLAGEPTPENLEIACRLTVTYSDAPRDELVDVTIRLTDGTEQMVQATSMEKEIAAQWRLN